MPSGSVVCMSDDGFMARLDEALKSGGWSLTAETYLGIIREAHESMVEENPEAIPGLPDDWLEAVDQAYEAVGEDDPAKSRPERS